MQAMTDVLDHFGYVREALRACSRRGSGCPPAQAASWKRAQEELQAAVEIIERTKWR
jgi:hypothetical protein